MKTRGPLTQTRKQQRRTGIVVTDTGEPLSEAELRALVDPRVRPPHVLTQTRKQQRKANRKKQGAA